MIRLRVDPASPDPAIVELEVVALRQAEPGEEVGEPLRGRGAGVPTEM